MSIQRWYVISAAALLLALTPTLTRGAYSFVKIAEGNTSQFPNYGSGTVNDDNYVSYRATLAGGVEEAVYVGNGSTTTLIVDSSGSYGQFAGACINNSGVVAFRATYQVNQSALVISSGGVLTTLVDESGPFQGVGGSNRRYFNDSGAAAFQAPLDTGQASMNRYNPDGSITTIVETSGPIVNSIGSQCAINAFGIVGFFAGTDGGGFAIYTGSGGALTTIADSTAGVFSNLSNNVAINDSSMVAFHAFKSGGVTGIYTGDGSSVTTIVDSTGPFASFGTAPAINSDGTVAFSATLDNGMTGIFTGPDAVANKIVTSGDPLFGSTITSVSTLQSINNVGSILFGYNTANGKSGIALAIIPEPASGCLLAAGCVLVTGRRQRLP